MKRCPYCAEEIQDEAIKCRWCMSWLTDEPPAGAEKAAAAGDEKEEASIQQPAPASAAAPEATPAAEPETAPAPVTQTAVAAAPATAPEKIEFTHTGSRYVLGYATDYFGIWDRSNPSIPVYRFPRTSEGWQAAWVQYTSIESNFVEVAKGS